MADKRIITGRTEVPDRDTRAADETGRFITYREAAELIAGSLASLRIYVVESDITEEQNRIRAIVEQASF